MNTDQFAGVYRFGTIRAASPVPLVQLPVDDGPPDVVIRLAPELRAPPALEWSNGDPFSAECDDTLIGVAGDVRWVFRPGLMAAEMRMGDAEIIVHTALTEHDATLAHLVGDYAIPYHLGTTGVLVLHGSCVAKDGRAVAFIGPSGVGKSTIAARLVRHYGFDLLADDAIVIPSQDPPTVVASSTALRSWSSALPAFGLRTKEKAAAVMPGAAKGYFRLGRQGARVASLGAPLRSLTLRRYA